ncbi:MAG: hypothetical protein ACK5IJ_09190 [Mangrovibacterium sp.]
MEIYSTHLVWTMIAQWGIFISLSTMIYGKIEHKEWGKHIGLGLFVVLGIYSLLVIKLEIVTIPEVVEGGVIPLEVKMATFFRGLSFAGLMSVVILLLNAMKKYPIVSKVLSAILILFALLLFFMVYNLQKNAPCV